MYVNKGCLKATSDIAHRCFWASEGEAEHFFTITAPADLGFKEQIKYIEGNYAEKIRTLGLASETAVFRRFFLSDAINQTEVVRRSHLVGESDDHPIAISIIQQQPMPNSRIALFAYHIEGNKPFKKQRLSPRHVLIRKNGLRHLWSTHICTQNHNKSFSSSVQTDSIFKNLIDVLSSQGGDLFHNCIRTWIYVKDIDIFYQGMVEERRRLFRRNGLRVDTHFIASTGIEGTCAHLYDLVVMDAYSIFGLSNQQVRYLNDFNMLCATKDYNVTFERGTQIAYADRSHYFISGTASIDAQGDILYPGNVLKQLDRTLANMEALLRSGHATCDDMMYMLVYLRDPCDFECVQAQLSDRFPFVPMVVVQGSICRPEWLIEIEGVAITTNQQSSYPSF